MRPTGIFAMHVHAPGSGQHDENAVLIEPSATPSSTPPRLGGALRLAVLAFVGGLAVWCVSSASARRPAIKASVSIVTGWDEIKDKVSACSLPKDFCKTNPEREDSLSYRDCDGDGLLDPYCTGGEMMRFGYISSDNNCENNWPNGLCPLSAEPDMKLESTEEHAAPNEITIVHFNDVYEIAGILNNGIRSGGMSRALYKVKKERERNPDRTFVVFAGDGLSPSSLSSLFQGEQMIDVLNRFDMDAASLGNHEFDFGIDVLQDRLSASNFPWLNVNLKNENGHLLGNTTKYYIREVPWKTRWGEEVEDKTVKVCFFGASYDVRETMFLDKERVQYADIFAESEKAADHLRNVEKCDVVIPLTHQFSEEDCQLSKRLGDKVDLILGGHDHSTELTTVCGHAPYAKADSDLRTQWTMSLWLNDDGKVHHIDGRITTITDTDEFDIDLHDVIVNWMNRAEAKLSEPMGCTAEDFDTFPAHMRKGETNTGNLFTDAIRKEHKVDVALWNGGSIRGDKMLPAGPMTRKICTTMHPYGNDVVKFYATGKELKEYIEHSLRCFDPAAPCGDFVQISGLRYEFNPTNKVGQRLVKLTAADGTEVVDAQEFTVGMSDFMYFNSHFVDNKLYDMVTVNDKVPVMLALYKAFEDAGDSCVDVKVDGRIKNVADA